MTALTIVWESTITIGNYPTVYRLDSDQNRSMSQASQEYPSQKTFAGGCSMIEWLRRCLQEHRAMVAVASTAVAAISVAAFSPGNNRLAASTFAHQTELSSLEKSDASKQSGIQIIPRGADSAGPTVPFRRSPQTETPSALRPRVARTDGQRGILHRPVFSNSSTSNQPTFSANSTQSSAPEAPVVATGHSGIKSGPKTERRSSGYNYVEAAGIEALPYSDSRNTGNFADVQSGAMAERRILALGAQDAQTTPEFPSEFPLDEPAGTLEESSPMSPVPSIPSIPFSVPADNIEAVPEGVTAAPNEGQIVTPSTQIPSHPVPHSVNRQPQYSAPVLHAPPVRAHGHSMAGPAPGTSGFRATVESDAPAWISPYMGRTDLVPEGAETSPTPAPSVEMPQNFTAWWDGLVQQRAGIAPRSLAVDVTSLVQQALVYSSQVQVLQAEPEVQQRIVKQEEATFDWRAFLDAKYDDLDDPIGNTLTTGNNDNRFKDHHVTSSGGVKRRTSAGGEVKLAQQFGYQDNNSRFLVPNAQSTSRLELSFRQPLMSRAGTVYNQNEIILARINANSAGDETLEELQNHLYGVAEAYWKLYRARAEFFQRQKLLASAQKVLLTLEGRNQVDTIPRQILRARASVARAESRMQRAVTDIRNAESQLRLLVNDPEMLDGGPVEFTPTETPCMLESPAGLRDSLQTALLNRPDISNAIRQMRAAGVRMGVSKSEMLPKLDFIVSSYVAGLENKAQLADSFNNQFTQGRPGFTVGMEFEVPLGNRAAKARVEQRQWELKRAISSFRATVETSLTEVEITSREVETSWRELLGKYQAMVAAQNEVSYLQDRFEVLPMVEESSMLLLEDLLDGYERLADEEAAFAQAQTSYALSIIQLRRTTGTMLRSRHDAPEMEPGESDWMSIRADQTANELESRTVRTVSVPGADLKPVESVEKAPAATTSWTKPAGSSSVGPSSQPPRPKNRMIGGHSFGSGF